jgi:hypothetical protein
MHLLGLLHSFQLGNNFILIALAKGIFFLLAKQAAKALE